MKRKLTSYPLPILYLYESSLTQTQKLLYLILCADDTLDLYELSTLARMDREEILFDLKRLNALRLITKDLLKSVLRMEEP